MKNFSDIFYILVSKTLKKIYPESQKLRLLMKGVKFHIPHGGLITVSVFL